MMQVIFKLHEHKSCRLQMKKKKRIDKNRLDPIGAQESQDN